MSLAKYKDPVSGKWFPLATGAQGPQGEQGQRGNHCKLPDYRTELSIEVNPHSEENQEKHMNNYVKLLLLLIALAVVLTARVHGTL